MNRPQFGLRALLYAMVLLATLAWLFATRRPLVALYGACLLVPALFAVRALDVLRGNAGSERRWRWTLTAAASFWCLAALLAWWWFPNDAGHVNAAPNMGNLVFLALWIPLGFPAIPTFIFSVVLLLTDKSAWFKFAIAGLCWAAIGATICGWGMIIWQGAARLPAHESLSDQRTGNGLIHFGGIVLAIAAAAACVGFAGDLRVRWKNR